MDLSSSKKEKKLQYNYSGGTLSALQILYTPIKIKYFEIVDSWLHPGKECVVMQTVSVDKSTGEIEENIVWTEAYLIIKDIRRTEEGLPHYTKFRRSNGYILFTLLNAKEKLPLLNL